MVAVAVIIAAVVSVVALGITEQTSDEAPTVSFAYDYNPNTESVNVTHAQGSNIDGEQLRFAGAAKEKTSFGGIVEWATIEVSAGSVASVRVRPGETLRVAWRDEDGRDTAVLGEYDVPEKGIPPATSASITNLNASNAAGQYAATPTMNGFVTFEISNVQPSPTQAYVEITDDNFNARGSDTITDTVRISGGSTGTLSYETCADIVTDQDQITVTIYNQKGGTQLAQDTINADTDGSPSGPGDTIPCAAHPG